MTDIKQIYTSHQSLVGTVTPSGKWYSPYNFGCYSSNQRLALACIFVYYSILHESTGEGLCEQIQND